MERRESGNFLNFRYTTCCHLFKALVISGFVIILYKAARLQIVDHQIWLQRVRAQTEATLQVPSYRGSICDRQGRLLSYSVPQRSLYANSDQVENPRQLAGMLASILGEASDGLEKKLAPGHRFVWIKRHLTDQQAQAVEGLKSRGLFLTDEYKRFYPYGQVAGQLLGFVGLDGTGLEGVEKGFDAVLKNQRLAVGQLRDGVRKCLWLGQEPPPESAESTGLHLTIDAFIQYLCERELEKAVLQYKARAGEVVVVDAETSEVLAMANWPFFDPNLDDKQNADVWRNRTVTDSFEPGSTFKVFLVSAALEEGTIKAKDRIFCENGKYAFAGHTINDVHPYGVLTIPDVIKHSSNIAAAKVAVQLGSERYYRYIQAFGFGSKTGINLPGEVRGLLRPGKRWRPIDLATTGFGQSLGVTGLQLNMGIACLANGGEYRPPSITRGATDSQGQWIATPPSGPSRRVIQKKTAQLISDMMVGVTQEGGTGTKAAPEGYTAAGKTGTAQVLDRATRRYATNKYTSVFTGFVPAEHPKLVITVVIHEPHGAIYGGVVAGPVFRDVAAKALPYLGIPPSGTKPNLPAGVRQAKVDSCPPPKKPVPAQAGKAQRVQGVQGAPGGKTVQVPRASAASPAPGAKAKHYLAQRES